MIDRIITIEKDGIDCVSANDMALLGFKVNPYAVTQETNKLIIEEDDVIDLIVPIVDIELVFVKR